MLKNYIKIAIRSLLKQKAYAFLNVLGLTIGITCSLLIFLYVQDELTYDKNHEQADNIYRVSCEYFLPNDGGSEKWATISAYVAQFFVKDYPEIETSVRFLKNADQLVGRMSSTERFYQDIVYTDANVFEVFTYPLAEGNYNDALAEPYTAVISEAAALKYFGRTGGVIGEMLHIPEKDYQLKVTGVLAPVPSNTHLKFEVLASIKTLEVTDRIYETWWNFDAHTYLKLAGGTDPLALEKKLKRISANYILDQETGSGYRQEYFLTALRDIHLRSKVRGEYETNGNASYVYIFSFVGIFILVIACINFMNLATARSVNRAKEVGVRKVVGAHRSHLIGQFLGESILMAFISLLLSVALVIVLLPVLNGFVGKEMTFNPFENPWLLMVLLIIVAFVGLLSGSYPALVLSAFRPSESLKGSFKTSSKGSSLRKGLVIVQFFISIGLIICTLCCIQSIESHA